MEFLGFRVGDGTIKVNSSKISRISNWPQTLHLVKEVCQILGVLGYQHTFIQDYAHIAQPLHNLLKKDVKFEWTPECKAALNQLINCIS